MDTTTPNFNVLWLQSGGCGGCSMSLLCADTADFHGQLRDAGINLLWHPSLSLESGSELIELLERASDGRLRVDALCIEGSLLRGPNNTGRFHVLAGTGIPMIDWVRRLAATARQVVAISSTTPTGRAACSAHRSAQAAACRSSTWRAARPIPAG
jgi:ferredoxin hydrogenase small subunit